MTILAHGVGGRDDLPLPLDLLLQGAAVALLVSFLVLGVAWTSQRFRGAAAGRPVPRRLERLLDSKALRATTRTLVLGATVALGIVAIAGPDTNQNPVPYVIYVLFWVGMPLLSVLVGPVWRIANPLRLLQLKGIRPYPKRLGYWPAAAGLAAFTWLELAAPNGSSPRVLALFFAGYAAIQVTGAAVFGRGWFARADAFEVYSALLGALAPIGRRADGRLVWRNPFDGLAAIPIRPGLVAVVAVCLGSTAFDGFSGTSTWVRFVQSSPVPAPLLATIGLAVVVAIVAGTYVAATTPVGLGGEVAPSLLPVVVGYLIAHYYSMLVLEGQRTFILLGLVNGQPSTVLTGPTTIAIVQLAAVLAGHVVGVIAGHDRAVGLLPAERRLSDQAPLLLLMVGYTTGGLTLLFAG